MRIKIIVLFVLFFLSSGILNAQFKEPDEKYRNKLFLGIFNPKNFTMEHSFQVSFLTTGSGNVSLTSYTNRMNYKISDKLNISADLKLQYAPFANSAYGKDYSSKMQSDLSGVYLSRLALDYKISENSFISFEFRKLDQSYFYDYYNNPFNRNNDSRFSNWR
jgi:hypothetical protein